MHQRSKLPTPSAATRSLSYLHQHITLHFFFIRISLSRDRFFLESVLHRHQPFFIINPSLLFRKYQIHQFLHLSSTITKSSAHLARVSSSLIIFSDFSRLKSLLIRSKPFPPFNLHFESINRFILGFLPFLGFLSSLTLCFLFFFEFLSFSAVFISGGSFEGARDTHIRHLLGGSSITILHQEGGYTN
ncbi:hypothetical protein LR48_Vigan10g167400 [Vigna angularis]|uniref:Uncharacterized protein n=1 Tax=Phaseolus angularis TaxID=3914 RepID=A0A0L9VLK6_PHAAN|nr:hypothetical protein LR48_Vigan10g167400 [Vigna angularis]